MRMKKILALAAALILSSCAAAASAATLITFSTVNPTGLSQKVTPVSVIDGYAEEPKAESSRLWALTDDDAMTSYSFLGWSSLREKGLNALTFTFNRAAINEIWMRSGNQQSEETYFACGRPSTVQVTITEANGARHVLQYRMEDRYDASTCYGDWYNGYQQLAFDRTYTDVTSISLFIDWYAGSESATRYYVHISDILFVNSGSQTDTTQSQQSTARYGLANTTLYTRSGPGTQYDELGGYEVKGQYVRVISAAWDKRNEIWWVQVDINEGTSKHRRIYTGLKRIDQLDVAAVPHEEKLINAVLLSADEQYYGPGPDYERRYESLPIGAQGVVYNYENGYVQLELSVGSGSQLMRVWVPEHAVSFYP